MGPWLGERQYVCRISGDLLVDRLGLNSNGCGIPAPRVRGFSLDRQLRKDTERSHRFAGRDLAD
jgi:hypothetical protein